MADTQQSQSQDGSLGRDLLYALRYYLGSRRGLLVLAGLAIAAGLALNWSWLAAAGIAPILISVLPCLAMCALGLCMNRMTGGACAAKRAADPDSSDIELQSEHAEATPPDMRPVAARRDTQIDG
ncbi:MAG: hypothetical protein RID96_19910 [Nitratireductor sp.]